MGSNVTGRPRTQKSKRIVATAVAATVCALVWPAASAAQSTVIYVSDLAGRVGIVNITTGTSTVLGNSGVQLLDIAVTESGAMWGVDGVYLYSLNRATGAATTVGALSAGYGLNALVGQGASLLGASGYTTSVYRIDPATAQTSAFSGTMPYASRGDLAFHSGSLYATVANGSFSDLVRLTISAGNLTSTNLGRVGATDSLFSLVQGSDGALYGIAGTTVWRINAADPALSTVVVADYAANGSGLGPAGGAASGVSIGPETLTVPNAGAAAATLAVTAISGCSWTAVSNASWITVSGGSAGTGDGVVTLSVAPNAGQPRTGTLTVAGQTVTVTQADTFSSSSAISIPGSGSASPYPSSIAVSGVAGLVSSVSVTLNGLSHSDASDIDMVLVGPEGQALAFMSDLGSSFPVSGATITFSDSGASTPTGALAGGTFRPSNIGPGDTFAVPGPASYQSAAPAGAATFASTFGGTNPNGTWKLYVVDDLAFYSGSVSGGWSLTIDVNASSALPVTPAGPAPGNDAGVGGHLALLDWADSAGATSYDVFLDGTLRGSVTTSQWAVNQSLMPGRHLWSVTARNALGATPGPTWSFVVLATRINGLACRGPACADGVTDVFIERLDKPGDNIARDVKTWIVIHGRGNSSQTEEIAAIGRAVAEVRGEQVLVVDWAAAAYAPGLSDNGGEDWIQPVGSWIAQTLAEYGLEGRNVFLIGHSWGSYVADELAERMPFFRHQSVTLRVAGLVALDAARNIPNGPGESGGAYNPDASGEIDFGAHAVCSWAFRSSDFGSTATPQTAADAFTVDFLNGDRYGISHGLIRDFFTRLIRDTTGSTSSTSRHFQLARLAPCASGPWIRNRFDKDGRRDSAGAYEGRIRAPEGMLALSRIEFVGPMPTNFRILSMTGNLVRLGWTLPESSPAASAIQLEGGLARGQVLGIVNLPASPEVSLSLPSGQLFLRVRAVAGGVLSDPSDEVVALVNVPAPPSAPSSLLGLVNGTSLTLAWTNDYSRGAPTSLSLDVTGSVNGTLSLALTDSLNFAGVPSGTYTIALRAQNAAGASAASNSVTVTLPGPCSGVPETPSSVSAYRLGSTVFVSWEPGTSGPAPTAYELRVSGAFVGALTTSLRAISGAVGSGSYTLSVAAVNPCGVSSASAPQTVVVP